MSIDILGIAKSEYINKYISKSACIKSYFLDRILDLGSKKELDDVDYYVWLVVDCYEERCGKIRPFSDVFVRSAFREDLYGYLDVVCGAYGNVCLAHK